MPASNPKLIPNYDTMMFLPTYPNNQLQAHHGASTDSNLVVLALRSGRPDKHAFAWLR